MSDSTIKDFWEERGAAAPAGELTTHPDQEQVKLEIQTILDLLTPSDTLLDIGCGNGFSTAVYAQKCRNVVGLDFSEQMIETAQRIHTRANLHFVCGDVLELDDSLGQFSAVLSTRCLINVKDWEKQKEALKRIHRCIAEGGCLILAEGTVQGRAALNDLRVRSGLTAMPPVWHNRDFDETQLLEFMDELFILEKDFRFGTYDVLTRVFYPRAIQPAEPKYGTGFHQSARLLSALLPVDAQLSVYSREFVMVFRKKGT